MNKDEVLKALVRLDPYATGDEGRACFFCDAPWSRVKAFKGLPACIHEDDCVWARAAILMTPDDWPKETPE